MNYIWTLLNHNRTWLEIYCTRLNIILMTVSNTKLEEILIDVNYCVSVVLLSYMIDLCTHHSAWWFIGSHLKIIFSYFADQDQLRIILVTIFLDLYERLSKQGYNINFRNVWLTRLLYLTYKLDNCKYNNYYQVFN